MAVLQSGRKQAGDTLVEVVLAIAIISVTLVSAYRVANNSYQLGVQARERIEAVYLAQGQAEMLRAWRDQNVSNDTTNTANVLPGLPPSTPFRVKLVSGSPVGFGTDTCAPTCPSGVGARYNLKVTSSNDGPATLGRKFTIDLDWVRIGGSGSDNTQVETALVDRRIDPSKIECDIAESC